MSLKPYSVSKPAEFASELVGVELSLLALNQLRSKILATAPASARFHTDSLRSTTMSPKR